jgi:hypothetical protein
MVPQAILPMAMQKVTKKPRKYMGTALMMTKCCRVPMGHAKREPGQA